jgi:PAS domain-containing protein
MMSNDYQTDAPVGYPPGLDSRLSTPTSRAGRNAKGGASTHSDVSDSPSEWKSLQLEPYVNQLLETIEGAVVALDCGVIIGLNQRAANLLGCPAEKILWRRFSKFIEPVSQSTFTRWIEAAESYTILVSGVRAGGRALLLRLEAVASLPCPGGRRVAIVILAEFAAKGHWPEYGEEV